MRAQGLPAGAVRQADRTQQTLCTESPCTAGVGVGDSSCPRASPLVQAGLEVSLSASLSGQ